jgi:tRNA 2-selenouridine synthase
MNFSIETPALLKNSGEVPIIDVRTPLEFQKGHIPGAINIPLFSDDERSSVGTIYKRSGRIEALLKGLEYAGPRMRSTLEQGIEAAGKGSKLALYCWRGGMRSESMAWLFNQGGIETYRLEGGYKAYRNYILEEFKQPRKVVVLGGLTGSGKTEILKELKKMGEQVVDLEGVANHKGSAFGAIGQPGQPSTEHFANMLFNDLVTTDRTRRLFLEDESHNIGSVFMPDEIYNLIRSSTVVAIMTDSATRMPRLLEEYGKFDPELLIESLNKISKRLGSELASEAIAAVRSGDIGRAVEIVLVYYDKYYRYGLSRRDPSTVVIIETRSGSAKENALKVIQAAENLENPAVN